MANYDDLFNNNIPEIPQSMEAPPADNFDREAWAAAKKKEREDVYALIDKTALELQENPDAYVEYLDIQSRFNLYSVGNLLLIQAQMPTATKLKDFEGWKAAGTTVRKNQQAISIIEPGKQYARDDHTIGTSMNIKKVFNISQTYAKPEQQKPPAQIDRFVIKALINLSPIKITASEEMKEGENVVYDWDKGLITVRTGLDAPALFRVLSENVAYAKFYYADRLPEENAKFKAQSVSYVLCRKYGVDMGDFTFDSMPDAFVNMDGESLSAQDIRAELTNIHDTANTFNESIRKALEQSKPDPDQGDR
jgi:hypothetical protein